MARAIVLAEVVLAEHLSFDEAPKQFAVQKFALKPAVQAFDGGVLPCRSSLDENRPEPAPRNPLFHCAGEKLPLRTS